MTQLGKRGAETSGRQQQGKGGRRGGLGEGALLWQRHGSRAGRAGERPSTAWRTCCCACCADHRLPHLLLQHHLCRGSRGADSDTEGIGDARWCAFVCVWRVDGEQGVEHQGPLKAPSSPVVLGSSFATATSAASASGGGPPSAAATSASVVSCRISRHRLQACQQGTSTRGRLAPPGVAGYAGGTHPGLPRPSLANQSH